jgi:hypothetical protein
LWPLIKRSGRVNVPRSESTVIVVIYCNTARLVLYLVTTQSRVLSWQWSISYRILFCTGEDNKTRNILCLYTCSYVCVHDCSCVVCKHVCLQLWRPIYRYVRKCEWMLSYRHVCVDLCEYISTHFCNKHSLFLYIW